MKKAIIVFSAVSFLAASAGLGAFCAHYFGGGGAEQAASAEVNYAPVEVSDQWLLGDEGSAEASLASYAPEGKYPDLTYAAERAVQAVVNIEAVREVSYGGYQQYDPFYEFFGIPYGGSGRDGKQEQRSGGSGVILSADGYIVTNNHVVEGATKLKVKLNDGRSFEANLVGADPTTDVALIKVEAENLPTIPFGKSDELRLGEWVLAIGSPFDLQSTITAGIVSAKARQLGVIPGEMSVESFIQTDAAVNPGNSGGALVNTRGELVGINTVIKSSTGSYIGYSFAVPETIVRKVVLDLKEYGVVQRAVLGVRYRLIDEDFIEYMGEELGISKTGGLYVDSVVENSAAADAGLRKGDIITAIDGVATNDNSVLMERIAKCRPNDKVEIEYLRNDAKKKVTVTLKNRVGKNEPVTRDTKDVVERLGGEFTNISREAARELELRGGVQVAGVKQGGLLARSGVKRGFVITYINDRPIYSVDDMMKITDAIETIDGVYPNGRALRYVIVE